MKADDMNAADDSAVDELKLNLRIVWPLSRNTAAQSVRNIGKVGKRPVSDFAAQRGSCFANVTLCARSGPVRDAFAAF
ncbi:hypothetical protein ABC974_02145 [Sphingomonas oligophenolica]|uniref:Uncharacterized protein n=1 Tax=Sphingomonas oligophenolica TaxID=301154 RepID=A0ABU9XXW8_9SPHN